MAEIHIVQIEIRSKKLSFILEFLKNISFIKKIKVIQSTENQEDFVIPKSHKDIVLSRRKTDEKDYLPLSELDDEINIKE